MDITVSHRFNNRWSFCLSFLNTSMTNGVNKTPRNRAPFLKKSVHFIKTVSLYDKKEASKRRVFAEPFAIKWNTPMVFHTRFTKFTFYPRAISVGMQANISNPPFTLSDFAPLSSVEILLKSFRHTVQISTTYDEPDELKI